MAALELSNAQGKSFVARKPGFEARNVPSVREYREYRS